MQALADAPATLSGGPIAITGYVGLAPAAGADTPPGSAQAGCPVVLDRLSTLTDAPFPRAFTVAGATLPNALPEALPSLRLVIPYELGMIELPARGEFEGRLLDPDYAQCEGHERFFVLERILGALPADDTQPAETLDAQRWPRWDNAAVGIGIAYPTGWAIEETRNVGAVLQAVFTAPDRAQTVRLAVTAGQTTGRAGETATTGPLAGARQLPAQLGSARARLVDAPAVPRDADQMRELRLVTNYQGNTVTLSTRVRDGAALDRLALDRFTAMAASAVFAKPAEASDPLDPALTARAELGPGPFLDLADAAYLAVLASGLRGADVDSARLVSERDARLAMPDACRDFPERPEAVWLVTVSGVLPTGQDATRLVYLDAVTGASACQTDARQ